MFWDWNLVLEQDLDLDWDSLPVVLDRELVIDIRTIIIQLANGELIVNSRPHHDVLHCCFQVHLLLKWNTQSLKWWCFVMLATSKKLTH